jgi:hypothetical protein
MTTDDYTPGVSPVATLTDEQVSAELDAYRDMPPERLEELDSEAALRYFRAKALFGMWVIDPPDPDDPRLPDDIRARLADLSPASGLPGR